MHVVCECSPDCAVERGTCHCGCGAKTRISPNTNRERGWVKGQPVRYIRGHAPRGVDHRLSELNEERRTATCSRCGVVSVKRNGTAGWRCCRQLFTDHRLSEINEDTRTAWCRGCRDRVPVNSNGTRWICAIKAREDANAARSADPERFRTQHKEWRDANREHLRTYHRKKLYGLDGTTFQDLLEAQDGKCAICGREPSGRPRDKVLHVDHDHETGIVRALLCHDCNKALGCLRDSSEIAEKAMRYLRQHGR